MSKRYPYAIFLNMVSAVRKSDPDPEFLGCEEILAFIAEKTFLDQRVRITDLVQRIEFGTGPTVHRKCSLLIQRRMISIEDDQSDRRAKVIKVTTAGQKFLERYSSMMKVAITEAK